MVSFVKIILALHNFIQTVRHAQCRDANTLFRCYVGDSICIGVLSQRVTLLERSEAAITIRLTHIKTLYLKSSRLLEVISHVQI